MRTSWRWIAAGLLWVPPFIACGTKATSFPDGDDGGTTTQQQNGDDSGNAPPLPSGTTGMFNTNPDAHPPATMVSDSACQAGFYQGNFTGSYSSNLAFGIPLTVSGNVELTLNQVGSADQTCKITEQGEFQSESCNNVFTLSGGTITGVANQAGMIGDVGIGGFPYYCTMTGTLDCAKKVLVGGWIECTYCIGPLADGGGSCDAFGGNFAGPLTANYDTTNLAFTGGAWNGSEALAGNDGGGMGPEGGPISNYLSLDGGYGFLGKYGGSGGWDATCIDCKKDH